MNKRRKKYNNGYTRFKHSDIKKMKQKQNYISKPEISYNISREITKDKLPEIKRNQFGDVIYAMQYIGYEKFEYWIEYDEYKRPISYIDSRGCSWNCMYNNKGNIKCYWDYTGYQENYRYYANSLVICTTSFGDKIKKKVSGNPNKYITRDLFIISNDY